MSITLKNTVVVIVLFVSTTLIFGQFDYPSLSPEGKLIQNIGNTHLEIEYERPCVRNRVIFGELVPWNEVWRTGAGKCTKISFDEPVIIGGQPVPPGKYSMFTIPNPDQWIVILNADTTLYGSFDYRPENDITRFEVIPSASGRFYEALTFDIDIIPNDARVYLSWENTQIAFDIGTTTDKDVLEYIREELLTGYQTDSDMYAGAAEYLYYQNTDLQDGIELTEIAVELDASNGWARRLQMELFEKLGNYEEALKSAEASRDHTSDREESDYWAQHVARIQGKIEKSSEEED